jgi:deoxyhypusine synthase
MIDEKAAIDVNDKAKIEEIGKKNVLFYSEEPEGLSIEGFDFNSVLKKGKGMSGENYEKLLDSYLTTGFQATHFAKVVEIINKMIKDRVTIYLGYTSNMITSGLREVFRFLAEHKKIDVIVTTAGGIEEDFIKCFGDFKLGKFSASGELLAKKGVNRTGNIYVPNERYCRFEDFVVPILEEIYKEQKKTGKIISVSELIKRLGKEINDKRSIYYWCYKNNIDVYCPAITDGSLGDMIHFFMYEHPDFKIDIAGDIHKLNEYTITRKKTGLIILGKGIMKHHILNSNMMRNGADYGVYINTGEEWDGADSNARPDEAVSWGKLKGGKKGKSDAVEKGEFIKVFGDATILFPLIVGKCWV